MICPTLVCFTAPSLPVSVCFTALCVWPCHPVGVYFVLAILHPLLTLIIMSTTTLCKVIIVTADWHIIRCLWVAVFPCRRQPVSNGRVFLYCFIVVECLHCCECWAVTKTKLDIDALDQWCPRKLLGIKWYHHVQNDEVRRTTGQPHLPAIVQARRFSLWPHCVNARRNRCQEDLNSFPLENWTPRYYVDEDYPAGPDIQ